MKKVNLRQVFTSLVLCFWLQVSCQLFAQNNQYTDLGSWNILHLKINLHPQWTTFIETQLRSLSFYNQFHYYEYKTGVSYHLNKNFSFLAGIGNYVTYAEGGNFVTPKKNDEIRTWLQLNMHQHLEFIKFEHRYRAEQRFTLQGYRNRFRYRFNVIVPLNKRRVEKNTLYLSTWNELFLTNDAPYFERNRFSVGLGYELTDNVALQMAWVNQFDYKINDEIGRNFLQIAILFEIEHKKHKGENIMTDE
jgi:hypothetical protein